MSNAGAGAAGASFLPGADRAFFRLPPTLLGVHCASNARTSCADVGCGGRTDQFECGGGGITNPFDC